MLQRLQKIIVDHGICSRREAERLIAEGLVTVNGKTAVIGQKADGSEDAIKVKNKLLNKKSKKALLVLAMYKPRGILCTNQSGLDESRGTLYELLPLRYRNLQNVGRLETEQEGLVLLTNDGNLKNKLLNRKYEVPLLYKVKIDGHVSDKKLTRLQQRPDIEGKRVHIIELKRISKTKGKEWLEISITDPRQRIVKKLFESIGHPVDKIKREKFANITIKGLSSGQFRKITKQEHEELKKWTGLA